MRKNEKPDYEKLLARAAKICSTSEKCSHEMHQKLTDWGLDEAQSAKAIEYLGKNQFIDDKRFAEFFVKDKFRINHWGKIKIAYTLHQKQLSDQIINEALQSISEEEYNSALDEILQKKIKSTGDISDYAAKAKVIRFAAQRGFSQEDIYNALGRIGQE